MQCSGRVCGIKEEVKVGVIMKAGGNEEAIQRRRQVLMSQVQALPVPDASAFAALFPVGASSECLFKSLHLSSASQSVLYLQGPDSSSFFKSQASEKVI